MILKQLNTWDAEWAARRLPLLLRELMAEQQEKLIVAGGFIRSVIAQEPVTDIDCFVQSQSDGEALAGRLNLSANGTAKQVWESDNAYSVHLPNGQPMVQFIHRWTYSNPNQILESFDFTIAMAALWTKERRIVSACHPDFYQDLAAKRLVYTQPQRNEDAGGSILRVLKFYQRGYRIPLDSLGAVVARLTKAVRWDQVNPSDEVRVGEIITGLLREVDPNMNPDRLFFFSKKRGEFQTPGVAAEEDDDFPF